MLKVNKILTKQNQQHFKILFITIKWDSAKACKTGWTYANGMMHHINRMKDEYSIFISMDAENAFDNF